jgi:rubrerythrin
MRLPPFAAPCLLIALAMLTPPLGAEDSAAYPATVAATQERYADEVVAHQKYGAYARHALDEGYPGIAHLFQALAASEAVHAENFGDVLRELGQEPVMPSVQIELSSTREHLRQAATVEAEEIDREYPAILERIDGEGHERAIRFLTYAWRAEQQHRDLILKIKKGASWFFGTLVEKIEEGPSRYYVCQICGSTLGELPADQCPICEHSHDRYREVTGFRDRASAAPAD